MGRPLQGASAARLRRSLGSAACRCPGISISTPRSTLYGRGKTDGRQQPTREIAIAVRGIDDYAPVIRPSPPYGLPVNISLAVPVAPDRHWVADPGSFSRPPKNGSGSRPPPKASDAPLRPRKCRRVNGPRPGSGERPASKWSEVCPELASLDPERGAGNIGREGRRSLVTFLRSVKVREKRPHARELLAYRANLPGRSMS